MQLSLTPTNVAEHGEGARRHGLPRSLAVRTNDLLNANYLDWRATAFVSRFAAAAAGVPLTRLVGAP
ncbi:hypothetical protein ABZ177_23710 [Streptomyces sp. NPDC006284]|uniref:hypothetical protein n=1 Tax=Streptomyces sp. NPDC006284 TaxID=3156742 RepID=UPI0033AE2F93